MRNPHRNQDTERLEVGGTLARLLWSGDPIGTERIATLAVSSEDHPVTRNLEPSQLMIVGRESSCDFQLEGSSVSRRHAALEFTAMGVVLTDLESRNGVLVNQVPVPYQTILRHGDRIQLGEQQLEFSLDGNTDRKVEDQLLDRAFQDGVTGVLRERLFRRELRREFARSAKFERPLGMVIARIEDFDGLRERSGSQIADSVLRQFARACGQDGNVERVVGRLGENGIAVLAPEASPTDTEAIAASIRSKLGGVVGESGAYFEARVRCGRRLAEHHQPEQLIDAIETSETLELLATSG